MKTKFWKQNGNNKLSRSIWYALEKADALDLADRILRGCWGACCQVSYNFKDTKDEKKRILKVCKDIAFTTGRSVAYHSEPSYLVHPFDLNEHNDDKYNVVHY